MKKTILLTALLALFSSVALGQKGESPREVGERLRGDAERAENRGERERAREARQAAGRAERSNVDGARQIERDYNRGGSNSGGGRSPAGDRDRGRN